ncbi:hypothetical protein GCM10027290_23590 [Micromonospora sonneratiae]
MLDVTTLRDGQGGHDDQRTGSDVVRRSGGAATLSAATLSAATVSQALLDYYLIHPQRPYGDQPTQPEGLLVEEFVLDEDHTAVLLNSAGWAVSDRRWQSASAFSRGVRVDADLRGRVVVASRPEAEAVYGRLGGGELPDEDVLRSYFRDGQPLATSAPLRLGPGQVTPGFHETRVHRILFANGPGGQGLVNLRVTWQMTVADDAADPRTRVIGTAYRRVGADAFSWDLRRISLGSAWCLDVTANLASGCDDTIGPLLRELTAEMRRQGLIPVTIERFS